VLSSVVTNGPIQVAADADGDRVQAPRLRKLDRTTFQTSPIESLIPEYGKFFKSVADNPITTLKVGNTGVDKQDEFDSVIETIDSILGSDFGLSLPPSSGPTSKPTPAPTTTTPKPTEPPTAKPSSSPTVSSAPTVTGQTPPPTSVPTKSPTAAPTTPAPTQSPSASPTVSSAPSSAPTTEECGIPEEDRIAGILAALDAVADPDLIRNNDFPQGLATTWLIEEDGYRICPGDEKLIQRWVLAVVYFSTGGDDWFQCSQNPAANDICGAEDPFVGEDRFLSTTNECTWAGISCIDGCVTEIEFEENNLVGTIPTEVSIERVECEALFPFIPCSHTLILGIFYQMGLLSDLAVWGMERGGLTGPIPTEIGFLTDLIFLDLDFNQLSGSLSSELLALSSLTQLDLNNNQLTGSVNGIGVFPDMEFLQLHDNFFTGTIPVSLGDSTKLSAFTLHETGIGGTMPDSVCDLLATRANGGVLGSLIADCTEPGPDIVCTCCTDCRDT